MTGAPYTLDLHVHSRLSGDNLADPEECVVRAIELGLQGIAFTEHYSYGVSEPVERLRERYRGKILILRGVEFSAAEGHCLVFGADTDRLLLQYAPAEELVRAVNRRGGAVIPAHPYRGGSGIGEQILTLPGIAAVEGYNGCNLEAINRRAVVVARRLRLPVSGGSDAHAPGEVGFCRTEFPERVTADNFIALLKAGNFHGRDARKISRGPGYNET